MTDLKAFAKINGLPALAEQLDDTTLVAAAEIAQTTGTSAGGRTLDADRAGSLYRTASASDNA
ncbi:MAG: hypothetical protein WBC68_01280 [Albidovulum sp.]